MDGWTALVQGSGFVGLSWQNLVMFVVAGVLIYLAVRHQYEPLLLIPIGFGAVLANLPGAELSASSGYVPEPGAGPALMQLIYEAGIKTELLPPLIFLGFTGWTLTYILLERPVEALFGLAIVVSGALFYLLTVKLGKVERAA